jgi:hypothetical protein
MKYVFCTYLAARLGDPRRDCERCSSDESCWGCDSGVVLSRGSLARARLGLDEGACSISRCCAIKPSRWVQPKR